jgi:hypothetical protein
MKITRKTNELPPGTIVVLPDEEILRIEKLIDPVEKVYRVQFLQDDGDEYIEVGGLRFMRLEEMIGSEC